MNGAEAGEVARRPPAVDGVPSASWDKPQVLRIDYTTPRRMFWEAVEVLLTKQCSVACRHCITNSHPGRSEVMSAALLRAFLESFSHLPKARYVCLLGGEPTLQPDLLVNGIAWSRELGLVPSSVTNGRWAASPEGAAAGARLFDGADRVQVSSDRAHREFIDSATTLRAVNALRGRGLRVTLVYTAEPDEYADFRLIPPELISGCERAGIAMAVGTVAESGRASGRTGMLAGRESAKGCGKLDTPAIDPLGRVFACSPGACIPHEDDARHHLGTFPRDSLEELRRRRLDSWVLETICTQGPAAAVRRLAPDHPGLQAATGDGLCQCGYCQHLGRVLPAGSRLHRLAAPHEDGG